MKIEKNKLVSVTYELRLGNKEGEIIETATVEEPLTFPFGENMLLPAFEIELLGKQVGDTFEMDIAYVDGYGEVNDYMIVDIPKNVFMVDGKLDEEMVVIGNTLPMTAEGQPINGIVEEIKDNSIKMNFNHPLAGKDLHFKGEIIDVSDVTEEKLGCGCDDDCDDDCGDDCECKK